MRKAITFYLIVCSVCMFPQAKNKANKVSRPSKEVTLNYINSKLQTYGVEYHKSVKNFGTYDYSDINGGTQDYSNTQNSWCSNYRIFERNNRLYLQSTFTSSYKEKIEEGSPSKMVVKKDESNSWVSTAPIDQLLNVEIRRARAYRSSGYPMSIKGSTHDEWTKYDNDDLMFTFSSKCVLSVFDDDTQEYNNWFIIAIRDGEENLLVKLRKAFLNLQTYYPKPTGDPFEN